MKTIPSILTLAALTATATPALASSGSAVITSILNYWPFIIGLVLVLLAFLWYQQIRTWQKRSKQPGRSHSGRPNQVVFLSLITVFAALMLIAPTFLKKLDTTNEKNKTEMIAPENRTEISLQVEGMTCTGCENAVITRVGSIEGVETVTASHTAKTATVVYDKTKTSPEAIAQTIEDAGYKVVEQ